MGRERLPPDDPREWLGRARSNLALAGAVLPEVDLEDLCFYAQQAAEKCLKAVFILHGLRFPFTHDLEVLLSLLAKHGLVVPKYLHDVRELTPYAVALRYPSIAAAATPREHRRAVRIAAAALRWAERQIGRGSS